MGKRIITFVLVFVCLISLTGCGKSNNNSNEKSDGGIFSKSLKTSDLDIKDFSYNTEASKCSGYDCYVMSLENNSKYDLIGVQFTYGVKKDATEEQLNVYSNFMNEHDGYIEDDDSPKDVILRGSVERLVQKNEKMTGLKFTVGYKDWSWYDYPTDEQFNLMEPKELQIGVLGEDKKMYIAYYDFNKKVWKLDEKTISVDTWSKKDIANKIDKPTAKHFIVRNDEDDDFEIYAYGVSEEDYNAYVDGLVNKGFTKEDSYSSHFEGKNNEGYEVDVYYTKDDQKMSLSIEKED